MIGEYAFPIVAIIALVALNGVFVAAEFALVGARLSRLEKLADDGSKSAAWLASRRQGRLHRRRPTRDHPGFDRARYVRRTSGCALAL
jgi:hypothetical protein